MSLFKTTAKSVKWVIISSLAQRLISFLTTIFLARLLTPSVFGLFALAFSVIDGFGLFKSLGIDSAIIQRKKDVEKAANTAFFLIPLFGTIVYITLFLAAPLIGDWLNNEEIVRILRILGVIYIFNCFSRVPAVLLEKNMSFPLSATINFVNVFAYSVLAVILAWAGWGIWSLVYAFIFRTIIGMILFYVYVPWRPKFQFDKKIAVEMFHFGKFLFLGSLLWYFQASFDKAVVGKLLGVHLLGFYAIALNLSNLVNDYITGRVPPVLFPAFSKIQDDKDKLKESFLKVLRLVSFFAIPFGCGMFLLGGDFLNVAFGTKWEGAIPVLRILAWSSIFAAIGPCISLVYWALGKPRVCFWVDSLQTFLFFAFIYPLTKIWGLSGVGLSILLSTGISTAVRLLMINNMFHLKKENFTVIGPILLAASMMIIVTVGLRLILGVSPVDVKRYEFFVLFLAAGCTYLGVLFKRDRPLFVEIKKIILAN